MELFSFMNRRVLSRLAASTGALVIAAGIAAATVPSANAAAASRTGAAVSAAPHGPAGDAAPSNAAAVQPQTTKEYWDNYKTGLCLDDGHGLRTYKCTWDKKTNNVVATQLWYLDYRGGINDELQNVQTKLCIDDGHGLRAIKCSTNDKYQWWQAASGYRGWFRWQNVKTKLCLDDSHGLRAISCKSGSSTSALYQLWL